MIQIENTQVVGLEAAIRGMRNPMNSWEKSDSYFMCENGPCEQCEHENDGRCSYWGKEYTIGKNDLALMKKLVKAGSDHSKFMRMINVTCDIVAPLYWWKEFDTYKVGTVRNSCSTMHKIADKAFTLDDFSHEHLIVASLNSLKRTIDDLNSCRDGYLNEDISKNPEGKKEVWWQMIQLLPSSYNQRATVQMNYAVLRNMYHARKNHKLDEWHDFCAWVESLPYSELITGIKKEEVPV